MGFVNRARFLPLIAALVLTVGCGPKQEGPGRRMLVVASVAPLADFARNVGGGLVRVELMVPPGASPHTYQPTPNQMKTLNKASVLVLNGIGLEFWADKAIDAAANPKLLMVRAADGIPVIDSGEGHHPGGNPHVWLNPVNAIREVLAIRNAFAKADPEHRYVYNANAARYVKRLEDLDGQIRREVGAFRSKKFVAFHPAWVYFAREYGLEQAAVIEESPGKEPSPAQVREVIEVAKRLKAKAIFAEPQFSSKAAEVVAEEAGAKVVILDPLGKPPGYDYISTMRANLIQMKQALR